MATLVRLGAVRALQEHISCFSCGNALTDNALFLNSPYSAISLRSALLGLLFSSITQEGFPEIHK